MQALWLLSLIVSPNLSYFVGSMSSRSRRRKSADVPMLGGGWVSYASGGLLHLDDRELRSARTSMSLQVTPSRPSLSHRGQHGGWTSEIAAWNQPTATEFRLMRLHHESASGYGRIGDLGQPQRCPRLFSSPALPTGRSRPWVTANVPAPPKRVPCPTRARHWACLHIVGPCSLAYSSLARQTRLMPSQVSGSRWFVLARSSFG
jgi:hypothetical protein